MQNAVVERGCDLEIALVSLLAQLPFLRSEHTAIVQDSIEKAIRSLKLRGDKDAIVQETLLRLFERPNRYDPERGSALSFVFQITREAARVVRGFESPLGLSTRPGRYAPSVGDLEQMTAKEEHDFAQAKFGSPRAMEASCDVQQLIQKMPGTLAISFARMSEGQSASRIAQDLKIDRFRLARRIRRYRESIERVA